MASRRSTCRIYKTEANTGGTATAMIEKINWQKELLESGKFNNKFSKNFLEHAAKKLYAGNISWIQVFQMEKKRGLDKDDPVENTGQIQSSFKEFEKKIE